MTKIKRGVDGRYDRIARAHNSRAKMRGSDGTFAGDEWKDLLIKTGFKCARCKTSGHDTVLTVDHIVPISKGGRNDIGNLQPLCRTCNTTKNNYHPTNYMIGEEDPEPLDDCDLVEMYISLEAIINATVAEIGMPFDIDKSQVFRAVVGKLNEFSGRGWGATYVQSVHGGYLDPSRYFVGAVDELHKEMVATEEAARKKKANRPDFRLRPVQVLCTKEDYKQILKLSTTERTEKFLEYDEKQYKKILETPTSERASKFIGEKDED